MKRYENQWSWITLVLDSVNNKIHFYLNDKESDVRHAWSWNTFSSIIRGCDLRDMEHNHII